jgi:hypothetical protein
MHVNINSEELHFLVADVSEPETLKFLPWDDKVFDVVIVILSQELLTKRSVLMMVEDLVSKNSDWFDVLGLNSEWLHDEIDLLGVKVGRQKAVGEGFPMTAWYEDITDISEMAEHSCDGLLSGRDYRVVLVIGDSSDYVNFVKLIQEQLIAPKENGD